MTPRPRSLADEERYLVENLPSIERRSLMESGMRRRTTRLDVAIVVAFLIGVIVVVAVFLTGPLTVLVHHLSDLVTNTGQ